MSSNILFRNNSTVANNSNLTPAINELIVKYQESLIEAPKGEISTLHVDEIASKFAYFYERVRKIVDWKEDNLLKRSAIQRILKRSLVGEISTIKSIFKVNQDKIAENLILELIRGGHLQNDKIAESKIIEIQDIVAKYIYFIKNIPPDNSLLKKKKINFFDWIMETAACEIEDALSPSIKEKLLIDAMAILMNDRTRVSKEINITEEQKLTQVYIAVQRALFDLDDDIISYHLLKHKYQDWTDPTQDFIKAMAPKMFLIWENIESELNHPLAKNFAYFCEKNDPIFTIFGDILDNYKKDPAKISEIFADKDKLKKQITEFYGKRSRTLKKRLSKIAIFSSLSVFVSNWASFFIVEVPVALLFFERFNTLATIVDFLLPTIVMFLLVIIIHLPPKSNLNKLIELSNSFVYKDEEKQIYEIRPTKRIKPFTIFVITIFYIAAAIAFFGSIAWMFHIAHIPVSSVILDTMTIALNVFAALIVRNKARELTVEDKSTFWEFLLDTISIPVAQVGSWFARKWKEYNVVAVFFNAVIELPFVTVIGFIEDWRSFLRDKKGSLR